MLHAIATLLREVRLERRYRKARRTYTRIRNVREALERAYPHLSKSERESFNALIQAEQDARAGGVQEQRLSA